MCLKTLKQYKVQQRQTDSGRFAMSSKGQQNGSSLVMALFIIVLMSVLLLALGRQLISSSQSVSIEVQGNRAFNAAQSGLQLGLTQLFPTNTTGICAVTSNFSFNQPGLQNCTATVNCSKVDNPDDTTRPFVYRLTSQGQCQAADLRSSRVVVMEAY